MGTRLELDDELQVLLGSENVYFQPPPSMKMSYPAIVYGLHRIDSLFANDKVYSTSRKYSVTLMDFDPDSEIIKRLSEMKSIRFDRHYKKDNLNHYVFTLHY